MVFQHQSGLQGGWGYDIPASVRFTRRLGYGILISIRITRRLRLWFFNISPDYRKDEVMVFQHQSRLQVMRLWYSNTSPDSKGWGYGIPASFLITRRLRLWYSNISYDKTSKLGFCYNIITSSKLRGAWGYDIVTSICITKRLILIQHEAGLPLYYRGLAGQRPNWFFPL